MLVTILNHNNKNAIADMYKDILNNICNRQQVAVVIPYGYEENEYKDDFYAKIKDKLNNKSKIKKFFLILRLKNIIKKILNQSDRKDVLFFHENSWMNIVLYFLLEWDINYYVWVHDPTAHTGEYLKTKIIRWVAFHTYIKNSRKTIVGYNEGKDILINQYGLKKEKIVVLNLPQMKELEFEDIKNDNNIKIKYDFIFYGRIEKYKGLNLLLEVFKDEALKNVKLLVVGRGKEDRKIQEIINEMENVTFINDYVPNRDLAKYIMQSRYVILPYETATGSQTVQIANYYDKMVLATKVGCFAEYIKEGKNGYFIDNCEENSLKKAIINMMNLKINKQQKNMILEEYNKFDLKKITTQLYNIIENGIS